MKAVEMMKKAIRDSELNGYKWTADKEGMHWSYGVDFKFRIVDCGEGCTSYQFNDWRAGVRASACTTTLKEFIDNDLFFENADDAIYKAALKIIRYANDLY